MKKINILSLIQAYDSLNYDEYKRFLNFYGINIREQEIKDVKILIESLMQSAGEKNISSIFEAYYVGYKIPQIGKEFDLLRFGKKYIINIEIKSKASKDKVQEQLERNKYYLKFLHKRIFLFTFVSEDNKFYCLNDNGIKESNAVQLIRLLYNQEPQIIENIDSLFNPSDYLVSPFNSTDKFISNEYFLTHQQEEYKQKIFKTINKNPDEVNFVAITGSAGTGKTLLTYDIAKEFIKQGKKVLIIHCGKLNQGQEELNTKYSWKIIEIKQYRHQGFSAYDLVVIDEVQRIYKKQLDDIISKIEDIKGNCIFSYDQVQTLSIREERRNIPEFIQKITSQNIYKLSKKIRTNEEIALFIKNLFNKKRIIQLNAKNNIYISFYKKSNDAKNVLNLLNKQGWKVIRFTPSQYREEKHEKYFPRSTDTSHQVIGQEFDNVVVAIDSCFYYSETGKLHYNCRAYYHPVKMLFQNITRTRKKLHIVIINNSELLNRCLDILGK